MSDLRERVDALAKKLRETIQDADGWPKQSYLDGVHDAADQFRALLAQSEGAPGLWEAAQKAVEYYFADQGDYEYLFSEHEEHMSALRAALAARPGNAPRDGTTSASSTPATSNASGQPELAANTEGLRAVINALYTAVTQAMDMVREEGHTWHILNDSKVTADAALRGKEE